MRKYGKKFQLKPHTIKNRMSGEVGMSINSDIMMNLKKIKKLSMDINANCHSSEGLISFMHDNVINGGNCAIR